MYDTHGKLKATPYFGETQCQDFDRNQFSLFPVRVIERHGLVFVNMDVENIGETSQDIEAHFNRTHGEFIRLLSETKTNRDNPNENLAKELPTYELFRTEEHILKCNWKTYVENYLEGLHIPVSDFK